MIVSSTSKEMTIPPRALSLARRVQGEPEAEVVEDARLTVRAPVRHARRRARRPPAPATHRAALPRGLPRSLDDRRLRPVVHVPREPPDAVDRDVRRELLDRDRSRPLAPRLPHVAEARVEAVPPGIRTPVHTPRGLLPLDRLGEPVAPAVLVRPPRDVRPGVEPGDREDRHAQVPAVAIEIDLRDREASPSVV